DVTQATGTGLTGFGMGCAVGDFDNDGFDDLAVTFVGKVVLLHNEPGGPEGRRFADVTAKAGIQDSHWATSCAWGDVDGDGRLDNYVANDMKPEYLFHNQGGGRFEEKGMLAGCALSGMGVMMAGMGIAVGDVDGSGRPALFVTNFQHKPNILFRNKG